MPSERKIQLHKQRLRLGRQFFGLVLRIVDMIRKFVIRDLEAEEVLVYSGLTERALRRGGVQEGVFIAESPKVISTALDAGYEPLSFLCEERHVEGDAREVIQRSGDVPVYVGEREVLSRLTGYKLTRGVLCAMRRKQLPKAEEICREAHRVAVIDGVCDTTNIGGIFRSAAALGIDGVLLTEGSCDPLNRRSVRVSMGSVFLVPWTWIGPDALEVERFGMKSVALALRDDSVRIDDPQLQREERLALILGTEGDGLSSRVIEGANYVARIPMSHGVDSLNVSAASAVAFWELRYRGGNNRASE